MQAEALELGSSSEERWKASIPSFGCSPALPPAKLFPEQVLAVPRLPFGVGGVWKVLEVGVRPRAALGFKAVPVGHVLNKNS